MADEQKSLSFPKDAGEIIRQRLKATFLEMMPDDALDQLVREQWQQFFAPKPKKEQRASWYGPRNDKEVY